LIEKGHLGKESKLEVAIHKNFAGLNNFFVRGKKLGNIFRLFESLDRYV